MVNHYYFYGVDRDFGPFFVKFCSYFPYNGKLYINGHEYAKRQLMRKKIAFEALDNGVRSCSDVEKLQSHLRSTDGREDRYVLPQMAATAAASVLTGRSPSRISLCTVDAAGGVFFNPGVRPAGHGRQFFEEVIRENIDLGRPDHVQLLFDRKINRTTPGLFRSESLPKASRQHFTCSTKIRGSSSTTKRGKPCEPKRRSTILFRRNVNIEVDNWIQNAKLAAA